MFDRQNSARALPGKRLPQREGAVETRLYRIVYTSQAKEGVAREQALQIFLRGRANNEIDQITGLLVFQHGQFTSVLEGPRWAMDITMERIRRDDRHHTIKVLSAEFVESRAFQTFSFEEPAALDHLASFVTRRA